MKIEIESTSRIVQVENNGASVPCRVWEGRTESGIEVQCLIVRIAASKDADLSQFERELEEQRPPSAAVQAFPLRMIL
jgi:hypothetical protein